MVGGSGFVGRHAVAALVAQGVRVTVPTRRRERAKHLFLLPTVEVIEADVSAPGVLASLVRGRDAVINLAGVLQSRRGRPDERGPNDYGPDFAQTHVELPQAIVSACRGAGVGRLLHMSALGADPHGPSEYLRSKGIGESAVLAADDLAVSVFRPSVIFGPEDRFLNQFALLARIAPVLAIPKPDARFQPVYVGDVVRAMMAALDDTHLPDTAGKRYDLCGPRQYSLMEIVRFACEITGRRRLIVGLPDALATLQAWTMEYLPAALRLLTRDNLRSMTVPSVCERGFPFGLEPAMMETAAATWLAPQGPRQRYPRLRWRARR